MVEICNNMESEINTVCFNMQCGNLNLETKKTGEKKHANA